MTSKQVHVILVLIVFAFSLFLVIAAAKYAEWARVMVVHGGWLPLVFYVGSVPVLSLFYTTLHLLALHFEVISLSPDSEDYATATLVLLLSILQFAMWLGQASVSTACELGPIASGAQGNVATWCPQSRFRDPNTPGLANMLALLAIVKDISAWFMVLLSIGLIECARRSWGRAKMLQGHGEGGSDWKDGVWSDGYEMGDLGKDGKIQPLGAGSQRSATFDYESRV